MEFISGGTIMEKQIHTVLLQTRCNTSSIVIVIFPFYF